MNTLNVKQMLKSIRDRSRPPQHENLAYNRDEWDRYAARWSTNRITIEDPSVDRASRSASVSRLGDEWGNRVAVQRVIADFITPFVQPTTRAAEIGSGGGRIAAQVLPLVEHLTCFDISKKMLERCRTELGNDPKASFVFLDEPRFDATFAHAFDFVYSFDVFVHIDLHTMWKYIRTIPELLRPGGRAFLHTTNLTAPDGWAYFASQDKYAVLNHYFVVPQLIDVLLEHAGLRIVQRSSPDASNYYYNRDDLFVVEAIT